jgi:phosphoribosylamine--glycine ligase
MNILVIGSGAREHALIKTLACSPQVPSLYCYGTAVNPGIQQLTKGYCTGDINDCFEVCLTAKRWKIELAIIGPEAPLERGMADALWDLGIPVIGPKKILARIETSKEFARDLMQKYSIPGLPRYQTFSSLNQVESFIKELGEGNYVIKANGLMGGKGVKIAGEHLHSMAEAKAFCQVLLNQNQTFIIEEKLMGQEFSFMCFADGARLIPMPLVQDHKRAYEGDQGPNTGGMGSYSDSTHSLPFLLPQEVQCAFSINEAVFHALTAECNEPYIGILYGSFIATQKGIYVIEFNARFGDPESLNVLSILESDFVSLCQAMIAGNLTADKVRFSQLATVCKYAVPEGYPDAPKTNFVVDFSKVHQEKLYFSSVNQVQDELFALGSRTAAYVGIAESIFAAEALAEHQISLIEGPLFHRQDIGTKQLIQYRIDQMVQIRNCAPFHAHDSFHSSINEVIMSKPLISILMGSKSDWSIMESASLILEQLNIPHEVRALSAHRTPDALFDYLKSAEERGIEVFIAAAGGAAHLPGVVAAKTLVPVLGVPMPSSTFTNGLDALLSIVQMPAGIPVGTLAVGKAGAINAAILATMILANKYPEYRAALKRHRAAQQEKVLEDSEIKG